MSTSAHKHTHTHIHSCTQTQSYTSVDRETCNKHKNEFKIQSRNLNKYDVLSEIAMHCMSECVLVIPDCDI